MVTTAINTSPTLRISATMDILPFDVVETIFHMLDERSQAIFHNCFQDESMALDLMGDPICIACMAPTEMVCNIYGTGAWRCAKCWGTARMPVAEAVGRDGVDAVHRLYGENGSLYYPEDLIDSTTSIAELCVSDYLMDIANGETRITGDPVLIQRIFKTNKPDASLRHAMVRILQRYRIEHGMPVSSYFRKVVSGQCYICPCKNVSLCTTSGIWLCPKHHNCRESDIDDSRLFWPLGVYKCVEIAATVFSTMYGSSQAYNRFWNRYSRAKVNYASHKSLVPISRCRDYMSDQSTSPLASIDNIESCSRNKKRRRRVITSENRELLYQYHVQRYIETSNDPDAAEYVNDFYEIHCNVAALYDEKLDPREYMPDSLRRLLIAKFGAYHPDMDSEDIRVHITMFNFYQDCEKSHIPFRWFFQDGCNWVFWKSMMPALTSTYARSLFFDDPIVRTSASETLTIWLERAGIPGSASVATWRTFMDHLNNAVLEYSMQSRINNEEKWRVRVVNFQDTWYLEPHNLPHPMCHASVELAVTLMRKCDPQIECYAENGVIVTMNPRGL